MNIIFEHNIYTNKKIFVPLPIIYDMTGCFINRKWLQSPKQKTSCEFVCFKYINGPFSHSCPHILIYVYNRNTYHMLHILHGNVD